jgi:hypothetical protein
VWPASVERVAKVFRTAGIEARLEELPSADEPFPGPGVRADAFACNGRIVVALVPDERETDLRRIEAIARCEFLRAIDAPPFPYEKATVFVEQLLLREPTVWIEAGSPRHVAALSPAELTRLVRAQSAELVADD